MTKITKTLLLILIFTPGFTVKAEVVASWKQLVFQSNEAVNFHHLLFDMARTEKPLSVYQWPQVLTTEQRQVLQQLVIYYQQHFIGQGRSPMRTYSRLRDMTKALTHYRQGSELSLPITELTKDFHQGLELYKQHLWPVHHQKNTLWAEALVQMLQKHGDSIQRKIEMTLESCLFKFPVHPVDIVFYPGHRNGAFTHDWPYTLINSYQAGYRGLPALEMIFHEVAHASAADKLFTQIKQQFERKNLQTYRDIWHPILFKVVGHATQVTLADEGISYQEYAQTQGLYHRGYFSRFTPFILSSWVGSQGRELSLRVQQLADEIHRQSKKIQ